MTSCPIEYKKESKLTSWKGYSFEGYLSRVNDFFKWAELNNVKRNQANFKKYDAEFPDGELKWYSVGDRNKWCQQIEWPDKAQQRYTDEELLEYAKKFEYILEMQADKKGSKMLQIIRKRGLITNLKKQDKSNRSWSYLEKKKTPIEEIIDILNEKEIEWLSIDTYDGFIKRYHTFKCKKCGRIWKTRIHRIIREDTNCPSCVNRRQIVNGEKYGYCTVLSELPIAENGTRWFVVQCECGEVFNQTLDKLGNKCKKCYHTTQNNKMYDETYEKLIQYCNENNIIFYCSREEYHGIHTLIKLHCTQCGEIFTRNAVEIIKSPHNICESCMNKHLGNVLKYTYDEVVELCNKNGYKLLSTKDEFEKTYSSAVDTILRCSCLNCGKEIQCAIYNILGGTKKYCSKCSGKMSSFERIVYENLCKIFKNYHIISQYNGKQKRIKTYNEEKGKYTSQYFDFFIEDIGEHGLAIEANGGYHFNHPSSASLKTVKIHETTIKRDKRKRKYCDEHGIILVNINVTDFKNYSQITEQSLLDILSKVGINVKSVKGSNTSK